MYVAYILAAVTILYLAKLLPVALKFIRCGVAFFQRYISIIRLSSCFAEE